MPQKKKKSVRALKKEKLLIDFLSYITLIWKKSDEGGLKMKLLMWDNSIYVFWSLPQVPGSELL